MARVATRARRVATAGEAVGSASGSATATRQETATDAMRTATARGRPRLGPGLRADEGGAALADSSAISTRTGATRRLETTSDDLPSADPPNESAARPPL